jgi:uridine phosphorylase
VYWLATAGKLATIPTVRATPKSSVDGPEEHAVARARLAPGHRTAQLGIGSGEVAKHVLLVSEPLRAERAARRLAAIRYMSEQLTTRIYTGSLGNLPVSVVCAGDGATAAETAVVELCQIIDEPVLIRVGVSAGVSEHVELGDLVIVQGAVRLESTSLGYVEAGFPALAHAEAQLALVRAAEERRARYQLGITASCSGSLAVEGGSRSGFAARDAGLLARLKWQGVLDVESEASCVLTLATLARIRAGAIHTVVSDRVRDRAITDEHRTAAEEQLVDVGLTALRHLARMDRERGERRYWHDGLHEELPSLRPRRA